jgi:CAAX protease family protein
VDRVFLGFGLATLALFSSLVVWRYWGQGNAITNSVVVLFAILSLVAIVQCWRDKIRLGFSLRAGAPRELLVGFGICVLAWAGIFLVGLALGAIRLEGARPEVGGLIRTLGILTANAAFQEVMFRVLILCGLIALFRRPWLAVGFSAILFGLAHAAADGVTAMGLASNALGGIMYGAAFVLTGRIWMPVGLHAGWNWMQGPVLGFNVSGASEWSGQFVHQVAVGSDLITGGAYVDGSVIVILPAPRLISPFHSRVPHRIWRASAIHRHEGHSRGSPNIYVYL